MPSISKNPLPSSPAPSISPEPKQGPPQTTKLEPPPAPVSIEIHTQDASPISRPARAESAPNLLRFPNTSTAQDTSTASKTYKDDLTFYADPGDQVLGLKSTEELRQKLGVGEDWKGAESIKALADQLAPQGAGIALGLLGGSSYKIVLRDLAKIKERHGLPEANKVAKTLQDFLTRNQPDADVNAKQLIRNALGDMAYPSNINQANKGTCAATAVQMKWALENPSTYAKAITQLGEGKTYATVGGDDLPPNDTWKGDAKDERNLSSRIMQNALMDMGNNVGLDQDYNSASDENQSLLNDYKGLYAEDAEYALQETLGADYQVDHLYSGPQLYGYVEDEIARGRSVPISFKGHAVLVTGIDKQNNQVIINTWGKQHTMTIDDFKKYVKSVTSIDDAGLDNRKTPAGKMTEVTH